MTSVQQLPIEAPSTKALPKGETPRGRGNKPSEEGGEGAFSAVLARALPESPKAEKVKRAVEPTSVRPEGVEAKREGTPTEDVETPTVAAAGESTTPKAASQAKKQEGTALVAESVPVAEGPLVEQVAAQAPTELGDELIAATETLDERPAAAPDAESVVEEALPEAEVVETEDAPRKGTEQPLEKLVEAPELETTEDRPTAKTPKESLPVERPQVEKAAPEQAELRTAAAVRVADAPGPESVPVHGEQAPRGTSALPQKTEALPSPKEVAVEQSRIVETPLTSKTELPRADEAPVIEFQVRKDSAAQDVPKKPESADWVRALQSRPAAALPKTAAPGAEAVVDAKPAEKVVPIAAVAPRELEPVRAEDDRLTRSRLAEHSDGRRPAVQAVAAVPQGEARQDDAQARRGKTADAAEAWDESVARKAEPTPQAVDVRNIVAKVPVEAVADTEQSKQIAVKPVTGTLHVAQPANGEQAVPLSSVPPVTSTARPTEATRPVGLASPPSEPAIAAKLQQESGRTTLSVVLQDERLGRVALQLVERGGWIETVIRASDPRTALTLANGAAGLFEALQYRGLSVSTGNSASAWDAQEGQRRDNPQRDQESQRKRFRLRRSGGEFEGALARTEV